MSSKIRNGKCTSQNLPFSPKATINKKIRQLFHSSSSGSSHKQLPRSKIQQDLQSNWLLEHPELLHSTAMVLEWTGFNLTIRVTLRNKARDVGRSAWHGRGGRTWCSAGKRLSCCEALPLPAASGQRAGFLMWILHPPLTDALSIVWSYFLYTLHISKSCRGFVWTQVPYPVPACQLCPACPAASYPSPQRQRLTILQHPTVPGH